MSVQVELGHLYLSSLLQTQGPLQKKGQKECKSQGVMRSAMKRCSLDTIGLLHTGIFRSCCTLHKTKPVRNSQKELGRGSRFPTPSWVLLATREGTVTFLWGGYWYVVHATVDEPTNAHLEALTRQWVITLNLHEMGGRCTRLCIQGVGRREKG